MHKFRSARHKISSQTSKKGNLLIFPTLHENIHWRIHFIIYNPIAITDYFLTSLWLSFKWLKFVIIIFHIIRKCIIKSNTYSPVWRCRWQKLSRKEEPAKRQQTTTYFNFNSCFIFRMAFSFKGWDAFILASFCPLKILLVRSGIKTTSWPPRPHTTYPLLQLPVTEIENFPWEKINRYEQIIVVGKFLHANFPLFSFKNGEISFCLRRQRSYEQWFNAQFFSETITNRFNRKMHVLIINLSEHIMDKIHAPFIPLIVSFYLLL